MNEFLQGKRLLVVDDHADNLVLLTVFFETYGAQVTTAENGQIAFEKVNAQQFDAIIADIQMPRMTGIQLLQHLDPQTRPPIIAVTARVMPTEMDQTIQAGFDYILPKPLDFERLLAVLDFLLVRSTK